MIHTVFEIGATQHLECPAPLTTTTYSSYADHNLSGSPRYTFKYWYCIQDLGYSGRRGLHGVDLKHEGTFWEWWADWDTNNSSDSFLFFPPLRVIENGVRRVLQQIVLTSITLRPWIPGAANTNTVLPLGVLLRIAHIRSSIYTCKFQLSESEKKLRNI